MARRYFILFLVLFSAVLANAQDGGADRNSDPAKALIVTSDIDLFWKAYDRATPANDLIVYRDEYLKKGSTGLKEFTRVRIGSVCGLVDVVDAHPDYFKKLRSSTSKIAGFEPKIRAAFFKLKEIYPDAVFPSVYFVIGKMNSGGTLTDKGLLIGAEMYGLTDDTDRSELDAWHQAVLSGVEKVPYIVAHELIHYQQDTVADSTLLGASIREGSADFIGELISGGQINPHLHKYGNPREKELWDKFSKEMNGNERSNWLYQGERAKDGPADLGYYMGYKIVESYYKKAADKDQAIREILTIKDFKAFFEKSGYAEKFGGDAQ